MRPDRANWVIKNWDTGRVIIRTSSLIKACEKWEPGTVLGYHRTCIVKAEADADLQVELARAWWELFKKRKKEIAA